MPLVQQSRTIRDFDWFTLYIGQKLPQLFDNIEGLSIASLLLYYFAPSLMRHSVTTCGN